MRRSLALVVLVVLAATATAPVALASALNFGLWTNAVRVEAGGGAHADFNGAALDGCPFISRDGKTFFMASRRLTGPADANNDINIWVSSRARDGEPWGAPQLVGQPVSIDTTAAGAPQVNDFCPTLARDGHSFYFVSNRTTVDAAGQVPCGGDDMYATRLRGDGSSDPVLNLGCDVNTPANEASPFPLPQSHSGPVLYFSSTFTGAGDIYLSGWHGGRFQGRQQVAGVNTPSVEGQPNVRRDGLEIFFFSNRLGAILGSNDIYAAARGSTADTWSAPVNLGTAVNTSASETRPSLSWDGTTLYFGSTRAGGDGDSDIYVTTRVRMTGG